MTIKSEGLDYSLLGCEGICLREKTMEREHTLPRKELKHKKHYVLKELISAAQIYKRKYLQKKIESLMRTAEWVCLFQHVCDLL